MTRNRPDPQEKPDRSPVALVVSYVLVTAGGGFFGFLVALCGIGNGARRGAAVMASDATHGLIILGLTLIGAALGFFAVWKTLGFGGKRSRRDAP